MNLRIAQCTPLVFYPAKEDPLATAIRWTQFFGPYDHIIVQALSDTNTTVTCKAYDALTGTQLSSTAMAAYTVDGERLYHIVLPVFNVGVYYLTVSGGGVTLRSADFEIVADPTLGGEAVKLEYSNSDNDTPLDNGFIVHYVRQAFLLRLRGGFKPSGYTPLVSEETWRTQRQELRPLYSAPYEKWTLTVGGADGVPVEVARLLNNILSCDIIYINGERWCRAEGAVPERTLVMTGAQTFSVSVELERQRSLDDYPNELYAGNGDYNADYNADFDKN